MEVEANGTRLWFDGRSARHDPIDWSFEVCADDVRAFCDTVGSTAPVVYGHSMGGFIAMLYAARHPGHAAALVLQSTFARFDLDRMVEGFRRIAGDDVAELARRSYADDSESEEEWARVFAAFGPHIPEEDQLARRMRNDALGPRGMDLLRGLDVVEQLARIDCPTLVCVGELDSVAPVDASREMLAALPDGIGRLELIAGPGHFPWLDASDAYWRVIGEFLASVTTAR
jgi:pimeloyl-ACP methyl ester carboxylesterase